jgi:ribosomal protein S18 acetylase RimI-like enzyme
MSDLRFIIRRAETRELAACAALYESVGRSHFNWRPMADFVAADFLRFAEQEEVWVAVDGERLLGLLSYYAPEHFVHCLYIDDAAQGQGVGRALLARMRTEAGVALELKVDEANTGALGFYEKLDWHMIGGGETGGYRWFRLRSP